MDDPLSALMPMMTLTVGEGDINGGGGKSSADSFRSSPGTSMLHSPGDEDHFGGGNGSGGDSDLDNDPNRFNAYLNRGSELWTHWLWLGGQGKMSLMRCNYCQVNKQLKNAPKCRRHLIKCPKTPEPVRRYFEKKEVEATRVSALMRELRSKEIKFPRNSVPPPSDPSHSGGGGHHGKVSSDNSNNSHSHHHHHNNKVPIPTANDLKHLQQKQHSTSLNSVIVNKQQPSNGHGHGHGNGTGGHGLGSSGSTGSASPADMSLSGSPKFSGVSAKSAENHHHHGNHQGHHHHQQPQHHLSSSSSTLDIKPVVHSSPLMLNGNKSAKHDNLNGGGNGNHAAAAAAAALRNNDNNSAFLNGISLYYQQLLYMQQTNGGNGIGDNSSSIDLSSKSSSASHSSGKRSASQRDLDYNTLQLLLQNGNGNHNLFNHNISSSSSSSSGKQKRPKRESLLTPSPAHHNQQQQQQHHHRDALSLISHQLNHGNGNGSAGSGGNGSGGGGNGNGLHILSTTNKENKAHPNNTVVINLDDVNALDESVFFNSGLGGGGAGGFHHQMPQLLPPPPLNGGGGGGSRKKKFRESVIQSSSNNNGSAVSSNGRLQHAGDATNGNGSTGMHNQIKTANGNNNGSSNGHTAVADNFSRFNPAELEVLHDDLNDLLASALLSAGVDFDFVGNAFFAQFINQLVTLSSAMGKASSNGGGSGIQYRLPPADKLLTSNLTNLVRKFDHETVKIFADADSIVVSLDWSSSSSSAAGGFSVIAKAGQQQQQQMISFDVNLLLCSSSSNALSGGQQQQQQLFYKTIPAALGSEGDDEGQRTTAAAAMLTQVSAVIEKVGAEQIHALVLPLDQDQDIGGQSTNSNNSSSSLPSAGTIITAFLATAHSHIVPLSNAYQLFSRLLCDICRIPAIHRLLAQCTGLFKDLARLRHFADFQAENEQHWKRVFESDSLKFYLHFLRAAEGNGNDRSTTSAVPPTNHWVSLNLVLCWFLVAKSSITDLFNKMAQKAEEEKDGDETEGEEEEEEEAKAGEKKQGSSEDSSLESLLAKHDLRPDQIERFFTQIHVLFNFLTPFITAVHLIENDSCVISDIVKIYFDVKMTIGADCSCLFEGNGSSGGNSNGEQGSGGMSSAKLERQSLDVILHRYLQEGNLSRYLYLAFYLDPRFRSDKRLEENEELISAVYDTLFHYATALGCVVAGEEEDRERLVDALEEFRNGEKLYGTALLKSPKSPVKYWKHLQRFPASAKLAYCASRLLSISTRAMLIGGGGSGSGSSPPVADVSTASLQRRLLALDSSASSAASSSDFEPKVGEKLLPIKSYLKLQLSTASAEAAAAAANHFDDEEGGTGSSGLVSSQPNLLSATDLSSTAAPTSTTTTTSSSPSSSSTPSSPDSISNIIANVITSLDHYSRSSAQPFTGADLARLTQTTSYASAAAASSSSSSAT